MNQNKLLYNIVKIASEEQQALHMKKEAMAAVARGFGKTLPKLFNKTKPLINKGKQVGKQLWQEAKKDPRSALEVGALGSLGLYETLTGFKNIRNMTDKILSGLGR